MTIDRSKMLQDAEEFERLVAEILAAFPDMKRETAERLIIHTGHKELERILLDTNGRLKRYIKARADNAKQLGGLTDPIAKDE